MEKIKKEYRRTLDKDGIPPTGTELLAWARRNKVPALSREVYAFLREEADPDVLGAFARRDKIKARQTVNPLRPGMFFIDYGEFHKQWSGSNSGCTGFLVAVENVTNKLFVIPCKGKDTAQWDRAVAEFVALCGQVAVIYSDRDSVATSQSFRQRLFDTYGITWRFLSRGNKSFLAERYIGLVKTKLSQALLLADRRSGKAPGSTKRWLDFVKPFTDRYNEQKIGSTSYKRKSVSRENFDDFLKQLFGPQPEARFNSFAVPAFEHHPRWNKALFKFELGDRVRVARKSDWTDEANKRGGFKRSSVTGDFGNKVYTVTGRQLRACKNYKRYVSVYQLSDMPAMLRGFCFYENELSRVAGGPLHPKASTIAAAAADDAAVDDDDDDNVAAR